MSDVHLFHTNDGGDVEFAAPGKPNDDAYTDLKLDPGLETASYLSMFGGNERDSGLLTTGEAGTPPRLQWWGNLGEPKSQHQRSETQHLLRSIPATSGNLLRVEDAVRRDHQWMLDDKLADEVDASASLVAKDTVDIEVRVVVQGEEFLFFFQSLWAS